MRENNNRREKEGKRENRKSGDSPRLFHPINLSDIKSNCFELPRSARLRRVLHVSCIATTSSTKLGYYSLVYSLTRSKFEHTKVLQAEKLGIRVEFRSSLFFFSYIYIYIPFLVKRGCVPSERGFWLTVDKVEM